MLLIKPKFWDYKHISLLSFILIPLSLIVRGYNYLKFRKSKKLKFNIPIICIGNIYLGGTGKTPIAIEIFKILKKIKKKPAFIKKHYYNQLDELKLLKKYGNVFANKSRTTAIKSLINNKKKIAILDDGLQENKIYYDFSIVCFNEKQWIGNGQLIPAGPLRESLNSLIKYNYVFINGKKNKKIEKKIFSLNPNIKIFYFKYKLINIKRLISKKIIAFAGIGNPDNFFDLLKKNKLSLLKTFTFPDHYTYTDKDIIKLKKIAKNNKATLITTEKDFIRLNSKNKKTINPVKINLIINDKELLIKKLKKI